MASGVALLVELPCFISTKKLYHDYVPAWSRAIAAKIDFIFECHLSRRHLRITGFDREPGEIPITPKQIITLMERDLNQERTRPKGELSLFHCVADTEQMKMIFDRMNELRHDLFEYLIGHPRGWNYCPSRNLQDSLVRRLLDYQETAYGIRDIEGLDTVLQRRFFDICRVKSCVSDGCQKSSVAIFNFGIERIGYRHLEFVELMRRSSKREPARCELPTTANLESPVIKRKVDSVSDSCPEPQVVDSKRAKLAYPLPGPDEIITIFGVKIGRQIL